MKTVKISRTAQLARLRKRLSYPVKHLNTVVVGLNGVRNGIVTKASELSVRWDIGDAVRTTDEARGFAIASLVVAACDALDQYLQGLGNSPSPIASEDLRSILRGDTQINASGAVTPNATDLESLSKKLLAVPFKDGRSVLRAFTEKHYGKAHTPSLRARFDALVEYTRDFPPNAAAPAPLKESYSAAVTLLLVWRNLIVHDERKDSLSEIKRLALVADAACLEKDHAAIDIQKTLDQFDARKPPTLKDVSTLVSILLRSVATLDAIAIYECDALAYFRETAWSCVRTLDEKQKFVETLRHGSLNARIKKLMPILSGQAFVPESFAEKSGVFPAKIVDLHKTFLAKDSQLDFLLTSDYLSD